MSLGAERKERTAEVGIALKTVMGIEWEGGGTEQWGEGLSHTSVTKMGMGRALMLKCILYSVRRQLVLSLIFGVLLYIFNSFF